MCVCVVTADESKLPTRGLERCAWADVSVEQIYEDWYRTVQYVETGDVQPIGDHEQAIPGTVDICQEIVKVQKVRGSNPISICRLVSRVIWCVHRL